MRGFQTVFFIVELLVYLGIGAIIAIFPKWLFGKGEANERGSVQYNYCYLYENSIIKKPKKKKIKPWNVAWFIVVMSITIYIVKPYILDIPQLITGRLTYVTDYVEYERTYSKDLHQYVYLSKGAEVKFFFLTDIKVDGKYKIGYLNNSKRAIYCEEIGKTNNKNKVMSFPFMQILGVMLIVVIFILLLIISPFLKLKVFIPVAIVSAFIEIFYSIKYGLDNSIYISHNNDGFVWFCFNIFGVILVISMLWLEKIKDTEFPVAYFFAQVFTVFNIGSVIGLIFNIQM